MKNPDRIQSGEKFKTAQGFTAIKDGIKAQAESKSTALKKPDWLKVRLSHHPKYLTTKSIVKNHTLSTVCEESKCPNISECWAAGTATIMLMGSVCTRACRFCSVDTGNPKGWLDLKEPENAAQAAQLMQLKYIVLTSVDRDDLKDGGANHYANCVREIKKQNPGIRVEVLTPDFQGKADLVQIVLDAGVDVFAQNIETVKRLTHPVRDPRASYEQTLKVLAYAKQAAPQILTKTSLILGLGETDEEITETMDDLRRIQVDILTLGQYLRPTNHHLPIERFVPPADFQKYRTWGLEKGFLEVASGPMVRSSYRAERVFERDNLGLDDA